MIVEHELNGVELDELADAAVADRQVVEQLERPRNDCLRAAPVLEVCYTAPQSTDQLNHTLSLTPTGPCHMR